MFHVWVNDEGGFMYFFLFFILILVRPLYQLYLKWLFCLHLDICKLICNSPGRLKAYYVWGVIGSLIALNSTFADGFPNIKKAFLKPGQEISQWEFWKYCLHEEMINAGKVLLCFFLQRILWDRAWFSSEYGISDFKKYKWNYPKESDLSTKRLFMFLPVTGVFVPEVQKNPEAYGHGIGNLMENEPNDEQRIQISNVNAPVVVAETSQPVISQYQLPKSASQSVCVSCGNILLSQGKFCQNCGKKIRGFE